MSAIPDRWLNYSPIGNRIAGTRFVAFKVPLRVEVSKAVSKENLRLDGEILLKNVPSLGLIIDLTNTTRYYDPSYYTDQGIQYQKLMTRGHATPESSIRKKFNIFVNSFLDQNQTNENLIGVHCTHGVNRTGYLICNYMIQEMEIAPADAIKKFNDARGHNMERENYIESLMNSNKITESTADYEADKTRRHKEDMLRRKHENEHDYHRRFNKFARESRLSDGREPEHKKRKSNYDDHNDRRNDRGYARKRRYEKEDEHQSNRTPAHSNWREKNANAQAANGKDRFGRDIALNKYRYVRNEAASTTTVQTDNNAEVNDNWRSKTADQHELYNSYKKELKSSSFIASKQKPADVQKPIKTLYLKETASDLSNPSELDAEDTAKSFSQQQLDNKPKKKQRFAAKCKTKGCTKACCNATYIGSKLVLKSTPESQRLRRSFEKDHWDASDRPLDDFCNTAPTFLMNDAPHDDYVRRSYKSVRRYSEPRNLNSASMLNLSNAQSVRTRIKNIDRVLNLYK